MTFELVLWAPRRPPNHGSSGNQHWLPIQHLVRVRSGSAQQAHCGREGVNSSLGLQTAAPAAAPSPAACGCSRPACCSPADTWVVTDTCASAASAVKRAGRTRASERVMQPGCDVMGWEGGADMRAAAASPSGVLTNPITCMQPAQLSGSLTPLPAAARPGLQCGTRPLPRPGDLQRQPVPPSPAADRVPPSSRGAPRAR